MLILIFHRALTLMLCSCDLLQHGLVCSTDLQTCCQVGKEGEGEGERGEAKRSLGWETREPRTVHSEDTGSLASNLSSSCTVYHCICCKGLSEKLILI